MVHEVAAHHRVAPRPFDVHADVAGSVPRRRNEPDVFVEGVLHIDEVDLSSLECVDDYTIEGNDLSEDDHYDLLVQITVIVH